jgi:hypothetical protein
MPVEEVEGQDKYPLERFHQQVDDVGDPGFVKNSIVSVYHVADLVV